MQFEEVGRELQRIGDDYNEHLLRVSVRARTRRSGVFALALFLSRCGSGY